VLGLDLELHRRRSFRARGQNDSLNLTNGSRQGDYPNTPSAETPARGRAGVHGRAGRVHVVDDADVRRQRAARDDAPADVPPPLMEREAALSRERAGFRECIDDRDGPERREIQREGPRRDVAALPGAVGIAGHGDETRGGRPRDRLRDESRRLTRQPATSSLLPPANEGSGARVVDDRRARLDECEPTARALGAAPHRPRARGAAPCTDRRNEPRERASTLGTQRSTWTLASDAPLGQQEIQRPHDSTVRTDPSRLRVRWVPRRAPAGRPRPARGPPAS
jgi:hypothetical protein